MMNTLWGFVGMIFGMLVAVFCGINLLSYFHKKNEMNKLVDLKDCPFKFRLDLSDYRSYAIFDLGNNAELYCEYHYGVRSDGLYGVSCIELKGLNGSSGRSIELNIGQSIFPIISKLDDFESWAKMKAFDYAWDHEFSACWQRTLKSIDNLRFLESKLKDKKKK